MKKSPNTHSHFVMGQRGKFVVWGVLLGAAILIPMSIRSPFYLDFIFKILFCAMTAAAWNISSGYAGALSLGHAAFFGIGAYTSTLLSIHYGISPWIGMIFGGAFASGFAMLIGYLSFRLHGPFFVLSTIAAAEVLRITAINLRDLTGGAMGLSIPFKPSWANLIFRGRLDYVYIMLGFLLLVMLISYAIEKSRLGFYMAAMREDEDAAESLGINTLQLRLTATLISAFLTAIGGTLYAQYILYIEPHSVFGIDYSLQVALMSIIGGMGTVIGPVFGAFFITPLGQYLRGWFGGSYMGLYLIIYGTVLIIVVLFIPEGIVAAFSRRGRFRHLRTRVVKWFVKNGASN